MKTLTYISDCGMIIQFGSVAPFCVTAIDLNSASAVFDKAVPAGMDGVYTQGGNYSEKVIPLEGTIVGKSIIDLENLRSRLAMAMNVHYEGTLIIEQDSGRKKQIRCRPLQTPKLKDPFGLGQQFACEWQCDKPYFYDYNKTIVAIGQIVPTWTFPFTAPVQFGYAVANAKIFNNTNIEILLKIEVLSQATAIEIKNLSNGQSFKVNTLIADKHKLVIDSDNCDIQIINMITGEKTDATTKLVAGSEYISLSPGENHIELNNGIADATPLSYITYYDNASLAV